MSRENLTNELYAPIGDNFPMKMTRENQLRFIREECAALRITVHHLEKELAKIPVGSIKALRNGKLPMRSDKWQKIVDAFAQYREERGFKNNTDESKKPSGYNEIEEVYAYTLKAIFVILLQQQLVSARGLEQILMHARGHYERQEKSVAVEVIDDLLASAVGEPRGVEQSIIHKLSQLVPLGVA